MKQEENMHDPQLAKWVKKGGEYTVSSDFTERLMKKIDVEQSKSARIKKIFQNPWLYLVLTLIALPFVANAIMEYLQILAGLFKDLSFPYVSYLGYAAIGVLCMIILFQIDQYLRYLNEKKAASNFQ